MTLANGRIGSCHRHGECMYHPCRAVGQTKERATGNPEPLNLESLRRREVQMMGAAISTRSWHDIESAYNQLRDKIDAELTRQHRALIEGK